VPAGSSRSESDPPVPGRLTVVASDVAPIGGMERVAYELCGRLLSRGWALTVIARSCALPPQSRLRFVRLYAPSRPVSLALAASFVHGTFALSRRRDGLVHTHNPILGNRADVISVHFCKRAFVARAGASQRSRDTPLYRLNSWLATQIDLLFERWCFRPGRVRCLAAVSNGLAGEMAEFYPAVADAVRVLPNGVDRAAFAPDATLRARTRGSIGADDAEPIALFVGGDWHRKGLAAAIDAVARAPDWRLVVVGAGDAAEFGRLAQERGAGGRVRFTGKLADPRPWYAAADAFVLPSAYETFSLATLEACAAGLVTITPPLSGIEEFVQDGVGGWLTDPDGEAIAARLRELGGDRALLTRMRAAARRASEPYDWERVTDGYEALFRALAIGG